MKAFSFLLVGSLRKYKPIQAGDVATAMVKAAKQNSEARPIYEYEEMKSLL